MSIKEVTGSDAVKQAMKEVRAVLDDPERRVFQIIGYQNIGKRRGVRGLLEERGIDPVYHSYTDIDYAEPIAAKVKSQPQAVHLWEKVYASNILHPEVLGFFKQLQDGEVPFEGTFLLVANDSEFRGRELPDLPGVLIKMTVEQTLARIEEILKEDGYDEMKIENVLGNAERKLRE